MCALSEMINLCSQPFKPANTCQQTRVGDWNDPALNNNSELTVAFALVLRCLLKETRQVDHDSITWRGGGQVRSQV